LPHQMEAPCPANDGIKEMLNMRSCCVLLQLFGLKPEKLPSEVFLQKAA